MATFSIDNDRFAAGIQDVTYDQSVGVQTLATTDDGNEVDVTLTSGELDGLDSGFKAFLAGLGLTANQKTFAVLTDAASSSSTFIRVSAGAGETINDLKLIASSTTPLAGLQTLTGDSIYVHVDSSGNYATLWTSPDSSGHIVGALALTNETIDNVTAHAATAGVQMLFFEGINHTDTNSQDESVSLSDVLKVGVDTAVSFNFEQLDAGNFLWAAVGNGDAAMLITGQDLNVIDAGAKLGDIVKGGSDPSDSVNTSKASDTTIGINAQHFAPTNSGDGAVGVFTFVTGFHQLELSTPVYTGQSVNQIAYDNFINVSDATIYISQLTGGSSAMMRLSLFEAGGGEGTAGVDGVDHAPGDLVPEQGYSGVNSYIGNQDADTHLKDDTPVNVGSVQITRGAITYTFTGTGGTQGGLTVTIDGNDVTIVGGHANDAIKLIALDDVGNPLDGTFNRVDIQALYGSAAFDIGHIDLTQGGLTSAGLGSHLFVDDDGPSLTPQADPANNNLYVDNDLGDAADSTDSSSYGLLPGTDGQKSYTIVGPADSTGTFRWTYDSSAHTSITGTYRDDQGVDHNLYTLSLNTTTGAYTFTMIGELPDGHIDLDVNKIKAGAPDTNSIDVGSKGASGDYITIAGTGGAINESNANVGVANGNLDTGESLTFTLHESDGTLIDFNGISIGTKSAQASTYHWEASLVGGGTASGDLSVLKNGTILVSSDMLGNVQAGSISITKLSGPATKIGLSDIHVLTPADDVQLGFTVELKDGDNDAVTQSFTVDIDGNNDGNFDATVNSFAVTLNSTLSGSTLSDGPNHQLHHDMLTTDVLAADHLMFAW